MVIIFFCRAVPYAASVKEVHTSSPGPYCRSKEDLPGRYLYAISLFSNNGDSKVERSRRLGSLEDIFQ